jgi:hypothetical protein
MGRQERQLTATLRKALADPAGVSQESLACLLDEPAEARRGAIDERFSGRMGVRLQAALRPPNPRLGRIHAVVTDVSIGGLSAEVEEAPPGPGPVSVEMCLPAPGPSCFLDGRVSWIRDDVLPARVGVILENESCYRWFAALKRIAETARGFRDPAARGA